MSLTAIIQCITGNIGYHQVHYLNPRIPNDRLRECYKSMPTRRDIHTLSNWNALRTARFALWDKKRSRMVTFREAGPTLAGSHE